MRHEVHLCGMKGETLADGEEAEYYDVYVREYKTEDTWDVLDEHENILNYHFAYQLATELSAKYGCEVEEI